MNFLKYRSLILSIALFLASMGFSIILFQPSIRNFSNNLVFSSEREILSVVNTTVENQLIKILKVRAGNNLYVEIYTPGDEGEKLMDRKMLTDSKDGFYKFEDENSNLFLKDINDDGQPEIVVPSFDKNLTAHLNIFRFDPETKELFKLSNH